MKKDNLTFEEIQAAEEASENRRRSRNEGFLKMHERDKAVQLMSNGATMLWHVPKELNKDSSWYRNDDGELTEIVVYAPDVPEDSFGLELTCKNCKKHSRYIFDIHEFRKWLRWG